MSPHGLCCMLSHNARAEEPHSCVHKINIVPELKSHIRVCTKKILCIENRNHAPHGIVQGSSVLKVQSTTQRIHNNTPVGVNLGTTILAAALSSYDNAE